LGYLTDEQLKAEYSSADVFCMPGRAELQSIATLEAMASGLPIVAVKANALPLLVEDGVNGFLYKAGDLHGLAYLLEHVVSDTERWRGLSAASEERARNHEISLTISNFEAAYQGIRQIRSHSNCG
jgi:glycosyltransferase involved in cell wall biosynthesis